MNRKTVAVVLSLIVVGAGITLILFPQSSDSFHFEANVPEGEVYRFSIWMEDLLDCTLNVSFIDDPELLYRMDVELYEPHSASSAFDLTISDYGDTYRIFQVSFEGKIRIKTLQLVLGSGVPYEILVTGLDVNATIVYGNNAVGSDASLFYSATGSIVNLIFTEDMVFSETGMEIKCGVDSRPDYIYLYVELPDGVNGVAGFREPLSLHSSTGWAYHSQFMDTVNYRTDPLNPEPLLELGIQAVNRVHAWLSD
ncbi:MAG: hypothetical protein ACTSV2_04165 [Candidatus Thorarchaeota archaeon]